MHSARKIRLSGLRAACFLLPSPSVIMALLMAGSLSAGVIFLRSEFPMAYFKRRATQALAMCSRQCQYQWRSGLSMLASVLAASRCVPCYHLPLVHRQTLLLESASIYANIDTRKTCVLASSISTMLGCFVEVQFQDGLQLALHHFRFPLGSFAVVKCSVCLDGA